MSKNILSILVFAVLTFLLCQAGREMEKSKSLAAITALKLQHEETRRIDADLFAEALKRRAEDYAVEVERGNALVTELTKEKKSHAKEASNLRKKVRELAANGTAYRLGPDSVRLWNEAIGAGNPLSAVTGIYDADSGGTDGIGRAGAAVDGGVYGVNEKAIRSGGMTGEMTGEPPGSVSEADALNHLIYYGERCRGLEDKVRGFQTLHRAKEQRP